MCPPRPGVTDSFPGVIILRPAAVAALSLALAAAGAVAAAPAQAAAECRPTSLQPPFFVVGHKLQPVTFDVTSQLVEVPDPEPTEAPAPAPVPVVPAAEGGVAQVTPLTGAPRPKDPKKFAAGLAKLRAAAKARAAKGGAGAQSGCLGTAWGIIEENGLWVVEGSAPTVEIDPTLADNAMAGRHTVYIYDLSTPEGDLVGEARQDLRRYTTWGGSFDASEPVKVNANVRLTGKLSRVNWPATTYSSYTGRPVEVQFQPVGGHFSTVARTTTGRGGVATVNVKATRDGAWRFFYPGAVVASRAYSVPDYVDTTPK